MPAKVWHETADDPAAPAFYRIPFEAMLKGSVLTRRREQIRQFGLSLRGRVRLVTSGDTVDRETYEALLAAGAVRPLVPENDPAPRRNPASPALAETDIEE
ncbi:MAG: hypothetical protein JXR94_19210 [Candidatus Hydrogenedentes bacterium]|nr:hypothetical protein [Candidatus Hydrogenedentota bacterium]